MEPAPADPGRAEAVLRVVLFIEAAADEATTSHLVDRQIGETLGRSTASLDDRRAWQGIEPGTTATLWRRVKDLAQQHGVRAHGRFDASRRPPDAQAGRRALLLVEKLRCGDVVVLVRDADDQPERYTGLDLARKESASKDRVVIGVASPEREAWLLAGFVPNNANEQQTLDAERQRLGFDPTLYPERLGGRGKRDAKVALENVTSGRHDRERICIEETPLATLRLRGEGSGLAAFLAEVEQRLGPLLR